ncbi:MAG: hypothetical protein RID07_03290 [Lacipirellulaceae bacterium]
MLPPGLPTQPVVDFACVGKRLSVLTEADRYVCRGIISEQNIIDDGTFVTLRSPVRDTGLQTS